MAIIIRNITAPPGTSQEELTERAVKKAGLKMSDVKKAGVHKLSLDARRRENIHINASVRAELVSEKAEQRLSGRDFITLDNASRLVIPPAPEKLAGKTAVAGFGPAGMFAALILAQAGAKPIVFERGGCIDERTAAVERFHKGGEFSPLSNVQFGEGGAGTFSDGKLTTRIKDPLCRYVSQTLVELGAPEEILFSARPHIGTDKLRTVVRRLRERIIGLGGEVRFNSKVEDIIVKNGMLSGVVVNGCEFPCDCLILAVGHSARDTFRMLLDKGVTLEAKPFAVGARIEHLQRDIDRSLYGKFAENSGSSLPVGEYRLSYTGGGRGVYTFCMCPGGTVVPSQSEAGTVVTNGMSYYARDGVNANAAVVAAVSPEDFGKRPLDGVDFAAGIERRAFEAAGGDYSAPGCTVGAFLEKRVSLKNTCVTPTYARGVVPCDLDGIFPSFVTEKMREGLRVFARRMEAFGDPSAVLTAPETRTSSPVRIPRRTDMNSVSLKGLYPCGEGAGYAGGIMSAAADGIRQALAVIEEKT
ncbi:MAG: hypothetical protein NC078_01415 [Ruminococcus sp.]|nr:hypothetical protein [Ruminococcus sp.]